MTNIDIQEIKIILNGLLGSGIQHRNEEVSYHCPFCNHYKPKLQINIASGVYHCWVCNAKGKKIASLLKKSNAPAQSHSKIREIYGDATTKREYNSRDLVGLPEHYKPLWTKQSTPDYKNALHYAMTIRKLTLVDILRYQVGYCDEGPYAGMIIIPSFNESNMINYYVGRSFYDNANIKHKNPPVSKDIIGFENQINWKEPIIIVEGAFDAIATKRNVVPLFGKIIPPILKNKILARSKKVYFALDKDAFRDALKYIEYFMNNSIEVYHINLPGKDPGELGYKKMIDCIKSAEHVDFYRLMSLKLSA